MKKIILIPLFLIAGAILYILISIALPASYDVAVKKERDSTKYWDLQTGSRIAYTFLTSNSPNKYRYPLIYLHGGPGAGITEKEIETYRQLSEKGYDVYLYDQVGCGLSERLSNANEYSAERHLADLAEIVKSVSSDKVVLVGQSWGSILAVSFLAKNLELVHKLVITAPAPIQPANKKFESVTPPDSLHLQPPVFTNKPASKKATTLRTRVTYYLARKYGVKLANDEEADRFATYMTTELNKAMVCDVKNAVVAEGTEGLYVNYLTSKSISRITDQRPVLSKLETPVLVMKAQCDNQLWGYTTEYFSIFKNHQFAFIKNAGHNIFLEQPAAYINAINEFLKQ